MKKVKRLLILASGVIFMVGCSTNIPMSIAMDDELVYDLEVNDSVTVALSFENQMVEGSFFQYEKDAYSTLSPVEDELVFNEYFVLDQMFRDFLRYRFTNSSKTSLAQVKVSLKAVTISSEITENDAATALNSLLLIPNTRLYSAEIQAEVIIIYLGQTYKRTIFGKGAGRGEAFRKTKADVNAFSRVLNQANNRVIYFTNQFLKDVGL